MTTKFRTGLALGLALLASAGAASAQIMLYEQDSFSGRSFGASNSVSNLSDVGFNDRVSSMIVRGGRWQICEDAYFRGRCDTLGPGEYPSLRSTGFNNKVSSVRELGWTPDGNGGWGGATTGRAATTGAAAETGDRVRAPFCTKT